MFSSQASESILWRLSILSKFTEVWPKWSDNRWKAGKKELKVRFPERQAIVDIREVTQSRKDLKWVIMIVMTIMAFDDFDRSHWPYGKRSRYVVKPHLVDSLQVHYVNRLEPWWSWSVLRTSLSDSFRNQPGFEVRVVKPEEGILAHFRSAHHRHPGFCDQRISSFNCRQGGCYHVKPWLEFGVPIFLHFPIKKGNH